jgi:hypothetical protein
MRLHKVLVIAGIGVSCLGAYWLGSWGGSEGSNPDAKPRKQAIGGLEVETASLQIGAVWEAKSFPFNLAIHNATSAEVRVDDFMVSCSCVAVEPRSLRIPAGQTADVHLTLELTQRTPNQRHIDRRDLRLEVKPNIKGNERIKGS